MGLPAAKIDLDLDDPLRGTAGKTQSKQTRAKGAEETRPRAPRRRSRGAPGKAPIAPRAGAAATDPGASKDPYVGSRKKPVNFRATEQLWQALDELVETLRAEGFETNRSELTEAAWHEHVMGGSAGARECVRRYRLARLG